MRSALSPPIFRMKWARRRLSWPPRAAAAVGGAVAAPRRARRRPCAPPSPPSPCRGRGRPAAARSPRAGRARRARAPGPSGPIRAPAAAARAPGPRRRGIALERRATAPLARLIRIVLSQAMSRTNASDPRAIPGSSWPAAGSPGSRPWSRGDQAAVARDRGSTSRVSAIAPSVPSPRLTRRVFGSTGLARTPAAAPPPARLVAVETNATCAPSRRARTRWTCRSRDCPPSRRSRCATRGSGAGSGARRRRRS